MPDSPGAAELDQTEVGSYFVANYPPFSVWTPDAVARGRAAGAGSAARSRACRSGCTCTSRSAGSAASSATSASTPTRTRARSRSISTCSAREWELYRADAGDRRAAARTSSTSAAARRRFSRPAQLQRLVSRLTAAASWDTAEEVTFECEPGTLTEPKLEGDPRAWASRGSASASRTSTIGFSS